MNRNLGSTRYNRQGGCDISHILRPMVRNHRLSFPPPPPSESLLPLVRSTFHHTGGYWCTTVALLMALDDILGPLLLGGMFGMSYVGWTRIVVLAKLTLPYHSLWGVTCVQTFTYFSRPRKDRTFMRVMVRIPSKVRSPHGQCIFFRSECCCASHLANRIVDDLDDSPGPSTHLIPH